MESVHELATAETGGPGAYLELLQESKEPLTVIRCPLCQGLRSIAERNAHSGALCSECRRGRVVPRTQYHRYWTERFSREEIESMAKAIWG